MLLYPYMYRQKDRPVFLTASWKYLAMANYAVPSELLQPHVPKGTELDERDGLTLVSLVGFLFHDTKVFGIRWPWHTHFEEINLRLYIKRKEGDQWKRGVAFVSEIVPKKIIATIANAWYNEHYRAMPTAHSLERKDGKVHLSYTWGKGPRPHRFAITARNEPGICLPGTWECFIFEHFWGYNQLNANTTIEYGVEHPRWLTYPVTDYTIDCDFAALYGPEWVPWLTARPHSVMLAYGSEVVVRKPRKLSV